MGDLVLTTFDWVPDLPRGFVRDLRVRWALEEAGLPYRVESTPFRDRAPAHIARQSFGQVPWLADDDLTLFESGATLLHLGGHSTALMPGDPRGWLAGAFSVADIAMADVLRLVDGFDWLKDFPAARAYITRATARPAFVKAPCRPDGAFRPGRR